MWLMNVAGMRVRRTRHAAKANTTNTIGPARISITRNCKVGYGVFVARILDVFYHNPTNCPTTGRICGAKNSDGCPLVRLRRQTGHSGQPPGPGVRPGLTDVGIAQSVSPALVTRANSARLADSDGNELCPQNMRS